MDSLGTLAGLTVGVLTAAVIVIVYVVSHGNEQNAKRLRRLENTVNLLVEHVGATPPLDAELEPVRRLAVDGEKIRAIKLHREITGSSLVEAKEAVERMV